MSASASRIETWPHVIGYWFRSCSIAATAACLTWSGAGKSGKPWARLIALCCSASLVISLITDSVSAAAVAETACCAAALPLASAVMSRHLSLPWNRVLRELVAKDVGDPVDEHTRKVPPDLRRRGVGPPRHTAQRDDVVRRREDVIRHLARCAALALKRRAHQVRAELLHQRCLGHPGVLGLPAGELFDEDRLAGLPGRLDRLGQRLVDGRGVLVVAVQARDAAEPVAEKLRRRVVDNADQRLARQAGGAGEVPPSATAAR